MCQIDPSASVNDTTDPSDTADLPGASPAGDTGITSAADVLPSASAEVGPSSVIEDGTADGNETTLEGKTASAALTSETREESCFADPKKDGVLSVLILDFTFWVILQLFPAGNFRLYEADTKTLSWSCSWRRNTQVDFFCFSITWYHC